MATLNIKNFPEPLYETLKQQAEKERRSLSQEVIHVLENAVRESEPLSILDLKGLGREYLRGIEAAHFIADERDDWDS